MSDTQRIDALLLEINEGRVYKDNGPTVDLARELERELSTLTAEVERKQAALELLVDKAQHFYAMVKGECPSLLEDDHNADDFTDAMDAARRAVLPVGGAG